MQLKGKMAKDGRWWTIECDDIGIYTQGKSKKNALFMMTDAIRSLLDRHDFPIAIRSAGKNEFVMAFSEPAPIIAMLLSRHRHVSKMSQSAMAAALGSTNHQSVNQYESGKHTPSIVKLTEMLGAFGLDVALTLVPRIDKSEVA